MARHRLTTRRNRTSRPPNDPASREGGEPVTWRAVPPIQAPRPKASGSGRHEKRRIADAEVCLDRPPAEVRAAIERYWADGLDPHAIVERLAGQGVTIHHVMIERYLYPGGGRI